MNKFRDLPVYANPAMSTRQIPENQGDWVTHVVYKGGREATSITSNELVQKTQSLWDSVLSQASSGSNAPVFMSCDLESPLGFASFLACATNFRKVFIPGTFNMTQMLKSVPRQHSTLVVCDQDFYKLQVPPAKKAEYQQICSSITNVVVAGDASGNSELFPSAKAVAKDKYSF